MRALPLLIVLAGLRADAHPVRDDNPFRPQPACRRDTSWKKFSSCQLRRTKFELLQDLPKAKLVAVDLQSVSRVGKRLELYLLRADGWVKAQFHAETNSTTELLEFIELPFDVYRLDVGFTSQTWVSLDEVSSRPAIIKRRMTYVCSPTGICRNVTAGCEVIVHGKAVALFRGVPQWDGSNLALRGDARNTNRYCVKPPQLIDASDE